MSDANVQADDEATIDDAEGVEFVDMLAEMYEQERQQRAWLRSCHAWMEVAQRPNRGEPKGRVQLAIDDAVIAACERAARIFRSDTAPVEWDLDPDVKGERDAV